MRVIAGAARGQSLKVPHVSTLRPTSDLVRGAIFDIIGPLFPPDTHVLDLYAGTGAMGIEALSRGCGQADLVERNPTCCKAIRENLDHTGFASQGSVLCLSVGQALPKLTGPYELVFIDPPYAQPLDVVLAERLTALGLINGDSTVVVEHAYRSPMPDNLAALSRIKERRHGDTMISVYALEGATIG